MRPNEPDNLQIVHSAKLASTPERGPEGRYYNAFVDRLRKDLWEVVDEGPMEDLLGIEVDYLPDGSIKLHQLSIHQEAVVGVPSRWASPSRPAKLPSLLAGLPPSTLSKRSPRSLARIRSS